MAERKASCHERNTLETRISVTVKLDGTGKTDFDTGIPVPGTHAGPGRAPRNDRPRRSRPGATCTSTITTRWRISALPWARLFAEAAGR